MFWQLKSLLVFFDSGVMGVSVSLLRRAFELSIPSHKIYIITDLAGKLIVRVLGTYLIQLISLAKKQIKIKILYDAPSRTCSNSYQLGLIFF